MMEKRYGADAIASYNEKLQTIIAAQNEYQQKADNGEYELIYRFGDGLVDENELTMTTTSLSMPGFAHDIELPQDNPFKDMV